jgi:FeS assembly SUF system regulator
MLRLSKLTDYGTIVLAQLATRPGTLSTAGEVAAATRLGQATVRKLLKALAHAGLVVSERGAQGGYLLARAPDQISAAQILDALEGPVAITECSAAGGECDLEPVCRVGAAWRRINHSIRRALDEISLADLQRQSDVAATVDLKRDLHLHVPRTSR